LYFWLQGELKGSVSEQKTEVEEEHSDNLGELEEIVEGGEMLAPRYHPHSVAEHHSLPPPPNDPAAQQHHAHVHHHFAAAYHHQVSKKTG